MASKQLGKLRQWAGEVISARERTQPTTEFVELERDIDLRKAGVEKLRIASEEYSDSLFRKKFSEALSEPDKMMPIEALGVVMISHGEEFGDDSAFGSSLVAFGRAHCRIATIQEAYAVTLSDTFLRSLQMSAQELNDFTMLRKKLESRRLAYDAAINKAEKVYKKEKDKRDADDELHKARFRYEETAEDLRKRMHSIREGEINQFRDLTAFLELEVKFVTQYLDVLKEVKMEWISEDFIQKDMKFGPNPALHSFAPAVTDSDVVQRELSLSALNFPTSQQAELSSSRKSEEVVSPTDENEGSRSIFRTRRKKSDINAQSPSQLPRSRANSTTAISDDDTTGDKDKGKKSKKKSNVSGWVGAVSSVAGLGKNRVSDKDNFTSLIDDDDDDAKTMSSFGYPNRPKSAMSNHSIRSTKSSRSEILKGSPYSTSTSTRERHHKVMKALFDYDGQQGELSFKAGDRITVLQEVLEGWWMGESDDGKTGLFPTTHVESILHHEKKMSRQSMSSLFKKSSAQNMLGLASQAFNKSDAVVQGEEEEGHISLMNGDDDENNESLNVVGSDLDDDDRHSFSNQGVAVKSPIKSTFFSETDTSSSAEEDENEDHPFKNPRAEVVGQTLHEQVSSSDESLQRSPSVDSSDGFIKEAAASKRVPPPPPPLPRRRIVAAPPLPSRNATATGSSFTRTSASSLQKSYSVSHPIDSSPFISATELTSTYDRSDGSCQFCGCREFKKSPFQSGDICVSCFHSHM